MAEDAFFRAGGLASGLDTNSIIEGLTKLEQRPLDMLRARQAAFKSQVSLIGSLTSKIGAFFTAAKALSDQGALGVKSSSTNTDFTATPNSQASAGSYSIAVEKLAIAGQQRTVVPFGAESAPVRGGTLEVKVQGTSYGTITINDGDTLSTVAANIRGLGAPVNVSLLSNGTGSTYLSITNKNTGFSTPTAATALELIETTNPGAVLGQPLGFGISTAAVNAEFTVDNLKFTRPSNTITDVIAGTTVQLKGKTNVAEQLTLDYDTAATATNLQKFVDAYNDIMKAAQEQLKLGGANTDRQATLAGDSTVKSLITSIQGVLTSTVSGLGGVRALADLGVKTNYQDGSLSIDQTKLASAIASDSAAVNEIFSDTLTGIGALAFNLNRKFTSTIGGLFSERTKSLNASIRRLDGDAERMQARIDAFKKNLVMQFTAMENVVSGLKSTGNFLASQSAQKTAT